MDAASVNAKASAIDRQIEALAEQIKVLRDKRASLPKVAGPWEYALNSDHARRELRRYKAKRGCFDRCFVAEVIRTPKRLGSVTLKPWDGHVDGQKRSFDEYEDATKWCDEQLAALGILLESGQ